MSKGISRIRKYALILMVISMSASSALAWPFGKSKDEKPAAPEKPVVSGQPASSERPVTTPGKSDAVKPVDTNAVQERISWQELGLKEGQLPENLSADELQVLHARILERIEKTAVDITTLSKNIWQMKRDGRKSNADVLAVQKEIEALRKKIEAIINEIPEIKAAGTAQTLCREDLRELSKKKNIVAGLMPKEEAVQGTAGNSQAQPVND